MISEKIRPHHLERKALLYVRQSSAHQVLHNRESSALQYAMRDRLTALGWSEIEVDREDLAARPPAACSAPASSGWWRRSASARSALFAAREVSRFARNSRDWQQLIEMCRVVDTVLVDQETVYAPPARQRSPAAGAQGQPQRVRARSPAPAFSVGPLREGAPGRAGRHRAGGLREGRRPV